MEFSLDPISNPETYETTRIKLRYGLFQSGLLVFASTCGISLLTYQYAFAKVKNPFNIILTGGLYPRFYPLRYNRFLHDLWDV